jgi:hypothetical protein
MASPREILFEFVRIGDSVRVAAIDPESGEEAVAIGPASASRHDLEQLALGKLLGKLLRKREAARPKPPVRPGRTV